ncbi:flavin-containing monooxygenase [Pseudomonas sp. zfem002]|uniref:flavin-containing monooxygenase n=1 Tax=Pseudomonas sp. zfem002 TaxID=3078197 RepID=UPI0029281F71|nr:NAD(P)-binding domain-containing protein [Pseudomonas sp. zfem002]MDU9392276.1 NAD(P)-binding domain-containing protein [Pseudomonas sp. zfem002]
MTEHISVIPPSLAEPGVVPVRPLPGRGARVCIVGAGVGGLSMARALKRKGIAFDCFERRERIGGIWAFDPSGRHTSVWYSMNMNTPKGLYQFSDFPMPKHYPDFPSHRQVHAYLESFVEHFELRDSIHLDCPVQHTERLPDGVWRVTLGSGEVRHYDALVVANGHHNTPNFPAYAAASDIDAIHSQQYRYRHGYQDKQVLVVGVGNSGAQIAVDVSHDARMTFLSLRRGVYVLPHYLFGIRIDKVMGHLNDWWVKKILPYPLTGLLFTGLYKALIAKRKQLGMPKPDHLMMSSLPTLSENFANRVGDGKLKIVPQVSRIDGNTVHFVDGSQQEVDAVIYATGYHTDFPFLPEALLKIEDNRIPLFQRIFLPEVPNLAFIGLFQAVTWGFLDMMERQAELTADYFAGQYLRPDAAAERRHIGAERKVIEREFLATPRNNYEMHGPTYMHYLAREWRQGRERASATGNVSPLQARAHEYEAMAALARESVPCQD